jgi:hypothetical protein
MKTADQPFFEWLQTVDCSQIQLSAINEGTMVFPREPLIRVEGKVICLFIYLLFLYLFILLFFYFAWFVLKDPLPFVNCSKRLYYV